MRKARLWKRVVTPDGMGGWVEQFQSEGYVRGLLEALSTKEKLQLHAGGMDASFAFMMFGKAGQLLQDSDRLEIDSRVYRVVGVEERNWCKVVYLKEPA